MTEKTKQNKPSNMPNKNTFMFLKIGKQTTDYVNYTPLYNSPLMQTQIIPRKGPYLFERT